MSSMGSLATPVESFVSHAQATKLTSKLTAARQGASSRTIDFSVDFNPDAFEAVITTNGVETIQKIENTVLDDQSEFDSKLCVKYLQGRSISLLLATL